MASKFSIAGQQPHAVFLRLDRQQLVEWVLVTERLRKRGSGMTGSQWQQLPIHRRGEGHNGGRVDWALPLAGDVKAVPLQPQFSNRHG